MVGFSRKFGIGIFVIVIIASTLMAACIDNSDDSETGSESTTPSPNGSETHSPTEITIGNLSDLTGVSSNAMEYINMALNDLVDYYNENNLIPGVSLKVVTYDGQMDPARDISGYEWLREKGADVIFTPIPAVSTTLKAKVNGDEVVLFSIAADKESFLPPGYVFNLGVVPQYDAYTLLKWIAENDWDWKTKGPAKIGGADWDNGVLFVAGMKEYCDAHPEQFEWEGGHLTNYSFTWGPEVEALKNCDYVYPSIVMQSFVKEYREAGHTKAKFIGTATQAAFFGMVDSAELWDEIDGMLFVKLSRWWNDEGEVVDLIKKILHDNHSVGDAESIIRSGVGYLAMTQMYPMMNIIANAAEAVGPQNLDSQALYDSAISYALITDGVQRLSFGEGKRDAVDAYGIYEARAEEEDIFRVHEEWYPTLRNP